MPSFVLFSDVFDAIPDMLSNKKINPIVTELFIRFRYFSCFYNTVLFS